MIQVTENVFYESIARAIVAEMVRFSLDCCDDDSKPLSWGINVFVSLASVFIVRNLRKPV